jgi:prepilin-type N-terminal cleavage/methylation domain-containing protein
MQNNMKKFRKGFTHTLKSLVSGFTLIELLVVIAIIGILSTIVLTSLTNTQARSYDSKIGQQLNSFRTSAQMYFTNHSGYGPEVINDCGGVTNTSLFNNFTSEDGSPGLYITSGNLPDFSHVTCNSTITGYSLKATLYSGADYWCVDSTGASRSIHGTPDNNITCP